MADLRSSNGVPFEDLAAADLMVDREYLGGPPQSMTGDPVGRLLPVGMLGGFRYRGKREQPLVVALTTSGAEADWPDFLDLSTGTFTYYGDNRSPGNDLRESPRSGNVVLQRTFERAHGSPEDRRLVSPYFLFASTGRGRNHIFRGVLAPGASNLGADEDLVAVWRERDGKRFQNYRAQFTVLDVANATRAWLNDILAGDPLSANCPSAWRRWVTGRRYEALVSTRLEYRSAVEQMPQDRTGRQILERVYSHFKGKPTEFEHFAAYLWRMSDDHVGEYEVTRASVDGGRDAVGEYLIGPAGDRVRVTFALEAKLYDPNGGSVGVKEVSRLISRLRYRQFGVLVTTGYVGAQAYREIRTDQHPVVIFSGIDIVNLLKAKDRATPTQVGAWLAEAFPMPTGKI